MVCSLGNGTASRETEAWLRKQLQREDVAYAVVDEAGASVYSASPLAVAELPNLDVSLSLAAASRPFQAFSSNIVYKYISKYIIKL